MVDRAALEAAAAAGVLAPEQVAPLHDFLVARAAPAPILAAPPGEEDLRFIRNFHDVFLAIGIVLFAAGLAVAIGTTTATLQDNQSGAMIFGAMLAAAGAVMWGLGEVFARRRRLFLPAIAIVIAFTVFSVFAAGFLYFGAVLGREVKLEGLEGAPPVVRNGVLLAAAFFVLAPLAFYARFRLPFAMGLAGAGASLWFIVAALFVNWEATLANLPSLLLAMGLLLFLAGVWFDARDPARASRFSDNGFWLHFAAAPLLLNGAFGLVGQLFGAESGAAMGRMAEGAGGAAQAAATLLVVLVLGFISLLINRRALIVSALLTTGVAIAALMNAVGLGAGALAASTLLVLGAFVLVLGAGWHGARRALLGWVKPEGAWARVFPPEQVPAR
ncbi:MAG: hypothetical protein NW200_12310 [Hyphomonadaceae bacterium]|nr:hypothetical protein [Hyphomonadaceae bacterium]